MELIRAENVTFGYTPMPVLRDVSLSVKRGEILSLLGPNGSGKTTLLKVLLGIYRPRRGTVLFEGKPLLQMGLKALARRIAYVPQFHRTVFAYNVQDVVLMGRTSHKSFFAPYSRQDKDIALQALERLSISHLREKIYTEISGGERQLTLIARALAQGADTLVMDEPANGLDYGNQIRLLDQIVSLAEDGYTFIKSTHFPNHALWIADRVVMLKEGSVLADGKPREVMDEETVCRLYNTEIRILAVNGNLRTCMPRSLVKEGPCHDPLAASGCDRS